MQSWPHILYIAVPAVGTPIACRILYGTFAPNSPFWGKVVSSAPSQTKSVSLTFDDGPTEGASDRILDQLGELGIHATFFVIGRNVQRWPKLIERMDAEGHIVANHSFDHAHFGLFRGPRYWQRQVCQTDDLIHQIIGKQPAMFRPPMGIRTWLIHRAALTAGHTVITWSRRAVDGLRTDTSSILRRLGPSQGGDILLLHDGVDPNLKRPVYRDRAATIAAIKPLIAGLRQRGLEPIRLDRFLGIPAYAQEREIAK